MNRQPQVCLHPSRCECDDCEREWLRWAEQVHMADLLASHDVITEAEWRREFAEWVDQQV